MALEDPGTTGPDGPALHQRGGSAEMESRCRRSVRRGFFLSARWEKSNGPPGTPAGRQVVGDAYADFRTLEACRPFGPFVTSNSTLSPSAKLLKPWAWMAL